MNISKEAIEAAAVAMSGWRFIEHEPGCGEHTELSEPARTHYARAALKAALPHLTAEDVPHLAREAWEECYEVGYEDQRFRDTSKRRPPNPYDEETDHE